MLLRKKAWLNVLKPIEAVEYWHLTSSICKMSIVLQTAIVAHTNNIVFIIFNSFEKSRAQLKWQIFRFGVCKMKLANAMKKQIDIEQPYNEVI